MKKVNYILPIMLIATSLTACKSENSSTHPNTTTSVINATTENYPDIPTETTSSVSVDNENSTSSVSVDNENSTSSISEKETPDSPEYTPDIKPSSPGSSHPEDESAGTDAPEQETSRVPVVVPEQETIKTTITDDKIYITPIPEVNPLPDTEDSTEQIPPTELKLPDGFDADSYGDADVYYVKIDDDEHPDIVVSVDDSTSMIWVYDSEINEYIYSEELSQLPETSPSEDFAYEGIWIYDNAQIEIINNDSVYTVIVSVNSDTSDIHEWLYYCELSGITNRLECGGNATKTTIKFNSDNAPSSVEEEYNNGSAEFYIDGNGCLRWVDFIENFGKDYTFNKL